MAQLKLGVLLQRIRKTSHQINILKKKQNKRKRKSKNKRPIDRKREQMRKNIDSGMKLWTEIKNDNKIRGNRRFVEGYRVEELV